MSVYIKNSNGDILSFDAITSYDQNYNSKVTEHPIESGGNITDHVVRNNVIVKISGLFSDFSPADPNTFDFGENDDRTNSRNIKNPRNSDPLVVRRGEGGEQSPIGYDYRIEPKVSRTVVNETVKSLLTNIQREGNAVTVFEIEGTTVKADGFFDNAIITALGFSETADSGDALYVNMTLEVVTFSDSANTKLSDELLKSIADVQKQVDAPDEDDIKLSPKGLWEVIVQAFSRGN